MSNQIVIVGAGMAGLLAANMLRRHELQILEKKTSLPDDHKAVLRFRTTEVSDATGIPFKKVAVTKVLWDGEKFTNNPTLVDQNRYSLIVTGGELHTRSLGNMEPTSRFVAPDDFVQQMAKNLKVNFGMDFNSAWNRQWCDVPKISTLPMPLMMKMCAWEPMPEFRWLPIYVIKAKIKNPRSVVHQTIYSTDPRKWYRASLHGCNLTLEFMFDPGEVYNTTMEEMAASSLGKFFGWMNEHPSWAPAIESAEFATQPFGKIMPIPEDLRKAFLIHLTDKYNIYSLGRFATWRPILLDDLVKDIKGIENMISSNTNYAGRL